MKYFYIPKTVYSDLYSISYKCNHPAYDICTLYIIGTNGLAVIQQRYDPTTKATWWTGIDKSLADDIYLNPGFTEYFNKKAGPPQKGVFPTVTVRQIMWGLKMKPIKREPWETVFDKSPF